MGTLGAHTGNGRIPGRSQAWPAWRPHWRFLDPKMVAAICIVSLGLVFLATSIKRVPIPASIVMTAGGITRPLYLLHIQFGYVIFAAMAPTQYTVLVTPAIISGAVFLAWFVWRFVERPAHRWTKTLIAEYATTLGWPSSLTATKGVIHPASFRQGRSCSPARRGPGVVRVKFSKIESCGASGRPLCAKSCRSGTFGPNRSAD
jgi:peptidoglycan/LPS O-acetylase OafA/YrhL